MFSSDAVLYISPVKPDGTMSCLIGPGRAPRVWSFLHFLLLELREVVHFYLFLSNPVEMARYNRAASLTSLSDYRH